MKAKELIETLSKMDGEAEVAVSVPLKIAESLADSGDDGLLTVSAAKIKMIGVTPGGRSFDWDKAPENCPVPFAWKLVVELTPDWW